MRHAKNTELQPEGGDVLEPRAAAGSEPAEAVITDPVEAVALETAGVVAPEPVRREASKPSRHGGKRRAGGGKRKRKGSLLSTLLIVIGIGLLATAGILWGRDQLRYRKQDKINRELATYVTVYDEQESEGEDQGPKPPEVDWKGLKAINDEVVAWLQVPGTQINYPIYQADNNDRYLRNTATGEWSVGGQLFNDYECTRPGMVDELTLTYGHHMFDGSMFESIADMDKQENFDAIDTVWYVTEKDAYLLEPLFLYYTVPDDQEVRTFTWKSKDEFHEYLGKLLDKAVTKREDAKDRIKDIDHVLSLITCNYYDNYGRTILVCAPKVTEGSAESEG